MKMTAQTRKKANAICWKFSGWKKASEVASIWDELGKLGIEIPMLTNRTDGVGGYRISENFTINGNDVENSKFVFEVYEGNKNTCKNEYNIYFG